MAEYLSRTRTTQYILNRYFGKRFKILSWNRIIKAIAAMLIPPSFLQNNHASVQVGEGCTRRVRAAREYYSVLSVEPDLGGGVGSRSVQGVPPSN